MKNYVIQKGDTFRSLARQFRLKDEGILKTYHNLHCPPEDVMKEPVPGKTILIPEDRELMSDAIGPDNISEPAETDTAGNTADKRNPEQAGNKEQPSGKTEEKNKEEEKQEQKEDDGDSSPHDGKYFIVQKGTVQCNQGFKFPTFKVTSHQKHYWNDAEGEADYLAATEDDLQFNPSAQPFGQCKLKPSSGGYLPCAYAPAGKWQKPYEKVKVMGKSCLTEISELMCTTGGKITILKHGQQSETGKGQVNTANSGEQQVYNPVVDFEEFKEDIKGTDELYYS
ncbi:DUF4280 domain-containing protein [Chryseobacterium flavum]|uniref:DUF4280 domain-containing protein n=1 Tax=Chryseobacterium flavum TaxID=415851 RepID=A0A3D9CHK0_9FLAO|nr:PAAR-like protein [Chryseobacterium flavum]REC65212.1 DUF4280 domain-containing protein [Chryseobacterium flavum]